MVRIKICGITNLEDALRIARLKVNALGFVFYKKSPRYIEPQRAKMIIRRLPRNIKRVGLFVNASEKNIKRIAKLCGLGVLQFHGDESPQFCTKFKGYKIIKALRIKDKRSLNNLKRYAVWAFLFDAYEKHKFGGTGRKFNWKIIKGIKLPAKYLFLSGGLTARNVNSAIKAIRPDWVDVSSAVESSPGKKDYRKVKKFIEAVNRSR